ncbi:MAG: hypothetical protein WKG01_02655 [Kofleriaceae bacterium]
MLELRADLVKRRERKLRIGPISRFVIGAGTFVLAMLGVQRSD